MKSLKLYLGSIIDNDDVYFESLLDDDDDFYGQRNDKKVTEEWINDNYKVTGKLTISKDFTVNCTGSITVNNKSITSLTYGLFKWGRIAQNFSCNICKNLKTLEGAPKKVGGRFDCYGCTELTSLEGAPKELSLIHI